jgi:rhomboid protease GluP
VLSSFERTAPLEETTALPGPDFPPPHDPVPAEPDSPDVGTGATADTGPTQPAHEPSDVNAFERRLKAVTPRAPVTIALTAANRVVFLAMALWHQRVLEFNAHILMSWGADYAPRAFGGQWWRAITSMFLHDGLAHLAGNLCFLLLIAPLVERLLGSVRFSVVYVFAGVGGGLLGLGWFPCTVMVGASAALSGVYGAFVGCYLLGPRTIPLRVFGRQTGVLVVYAAVTLLIGYLDLDKSLIPHLGGLLFGLCGGLLFGHVLRPRPVAWAVCHFVLATTACAGLVALTAWGVEKCVRKPIDLLGRYEQIQERERALVGRFHDGLRRWEDGGASDADLRRLLQDELIPEWDRARSYSGLQFQGELAPLEGQRISLRELLARARLAGPDAERKAHREPVGREYDMLYRLYLKLRADNWRQLADGLQSGRTQEVEPLMEAVFLELLRRDLDDVANEDNPLRHLLEFSRCRIQAKKQAAGGRK